MQFSVGDSIIVAVGVEHFETYDSANSLSSDKIMDSDIIMNPLVKILRLEEYAREMVARYLVQSKTDMIF